MAETSMGSSFSWWQGVVVNVFDPHESGRVQVRVDGQHDDQVNIPDEALPWSLPTQSVTSAAFGKIGTAPTGLVKGSRIYGFWADRDHQYPIILGSIGKSGDPVGGQSDGGAPAIDTTKGSIPTPAYSNTTFNNPYTYWNSNRISIDAIDSGLANIFSVGVDVGVVLTQAVEQGMKFAKLPTTAAALVSDLADVLNIIKLIDPDGSSLALQFSVDGLSILNQMMVLTSSVGTAIADVLSTGVQSAIATVAQQLGVTNVLNAVNDAIASVPEMAAVASALTSSDAQPLLQAASTATLAFVAAATALNTANNTTIQTSVITPPPSSIANSTTAVPPSIALVPPANYVQQYANTDPYPGYITWVDPSGTGTPIYTVRNGQPNFTSATDHTTYVMHQSVATPLASAIQSGTLTGASLQALASSTTSNAQSFAVSTVVGHGFSTANAIASAASLIPATVGNLSNVFSPSVSGVITNPSIPQQSVGQFTQSQALLSQYRNKIQQALS